jgi:hypothetical protein
MLRQQKESNDKQIQTLTNLHSQQAESYHADSIRRQEQQQKQHRETILELSTRSHQQLDVQATMFRNSLDTHIEHVRYSSI